ncbi:MAG: hypothetical protein HQK60_18980, partial [Deltaproteobacteria bacterium]|nr:hypothetical protein [Deltaproteobacteria bacterium]
DEDAFIFIKQSPAVLNCLDNDDAGEKAAWNNWISDLKNVTRLYPPKLNDGTWPKDITDAYQGGADLRRWVRVGLHLANKKKAWTRPSGTVTKPKPDVKKAEPRIEAVTPQIESGFFAIGTVEEYGYLDGRGLVFGPGDFVEEMTLTDWARYTALKSKRHTDLPDDLRHKMYLSPGGTGYTPAWPYQHQRRTVIYPVIVGQLTGFTEEVMEYDDE